MKKILITSILATFMLIWIISFSSASCIVQGYVLDKGSNFKPFSVTAYCQNDNSWRNTSGSAGETYLVSWGGPAVTCQSVCGQVYIKAEYKNSIPEEPWLVGYTSHYPLNSENTPNWSNRVAHNINITLYEKQKSKEKKIITKLISEEQQKSNQEEAVKEFNSVITKEYKNNKDNINKLEIPINNTNWFILFWNRMIKFIQGIFI